MGSILVGKQQAHRYRIHSEVLQSPACLYHRILIEYTVYSIGNRPLGHFEYSLGWNQRRGFWLAQSVEVRSCLSPDLNDIPEALGCEHPRACAFQLKQGIRCNGHSVGEVVHLRGFQARLFQHLFRNFNHRI